MAEGVSQVSAAGFRVTRREWHREPVSIAVPVSVPARRRRSHASDRRRGWDAPASQTKSD